MRFGLTILPEIPWAEAAPRWRAAEDLGFDHAWTYDHLVWGGLPESPTTRRSFLAALQPIETWSSCIALVGSESTLAGAASRLFSVAIAACV